MCKNGYLPNLVITSDHMAASFPVVLGDFGCDVIWPIFPLISHNDLQLFISNMASSNEDEIVERISAAVRNALCRNSQQQVRARLI